jgi:uncharacterized protein (DUF952 family)/heme-degrading monooxygenase HmoA
MSSPSRPYTAVIFTNQRLAGLHAEHDGYDEMSAEMARLASEQPGYLGIESVRSVDGLGITVSYWATDTDAGAWKQVAEHAEARRLGRDRWYAWYRLRVATVEREYAWRRPDVVFHLALPDDWSAALAAGEYTVSTRGITLADEGFIHCSYAHQAEGVANRFYADLDRLLVLAVDTTRLDAVVVVEPPFDGAPEAFPHVYGPITIGAVVATGEWQRASGEAWLFDADRYGPEKMVSKSEPSEA